VKINFFAEKHITEAGVYFHTEFIKTDIAHNNLNASSLKQKQIVKVGLQSSSSAE